MTDASIETVQKKIDVDDFNNMSAKESGRFMRMVNDGALSGEDIAKIIDSSSQFVNNFCKMSKDFRVYLIQNGKSQRALIEAATKGIEVQCTTLDSIASQNECPKYKLEIAKIVQSISRDFFKTIREFNKPKIHWWAIAGTAAISILLGMGIEKTRSA